MADQGDVRADPDSRARTHLANERTFLAWIRTGLTMIAIGLAAAQFITPDVVGGIHVVTVFSLFTVAGGLVLTFAAGVQFVRGRADINVGRYRSGSLPIVVTVALVATAAAIAIGIIIFLRGLF